MPQKGYQRDRRDTFSEYPGKNLSLQDEARYRGYKRYLGKEDILNERQTKKEITGNYMTGDITKLTPHTGGPVKAPEHIYPDDCYDPEILRKYCDKYNGRVPYEDRAVTYGYYKPTDGSVTRCRRHN